MENEITIRPAVASDATGIERVARRTWNATYANIILPENQERLLGRWYAPAALQEAIALERSRLFVATLRETAIGFAQFFVRAGEDRNGELSRIYVLPEYQRAGIGGRFLAEGIAFLTQAGVAHLFVVVEKDNPIGRRFYEKHGFLLVREFTTELPEQTLSLLEYRLDEISWSG